MARRAGLGLLLLLCGACPSKTEPGGASPSESSAGSPRAIPSATPAPAPSAPSSATAAPAPLDPAKVKFVRERPANEDRKGIDACAYLGGFGFACLDALLAEKDPVVKRYMRRLSDADARQALDDLQRGEPRGVAHAELALGCADSGACGATPDKKDDGYFCLTKAEQAIQEKQEAASKAAHERACKCGPERAQIPVMGGFLACDGKKPVKRGENMTTAEADEVRACGECDAAKGPAACVKEIERLSKSDTELATYIEKVHVPRCAKP